MNKNMLLSVTEWRNEFRHSITSNVTFVLQEQENKKNTWLRVRIEPIAMTFEIININGQYFLISQKRTKTYRQIYNKIYKDTIYYILIKNVTFLNIYVYMTCLFTKFFLIQCTFRLTKYTQKNKFYKS